MFLHILAMLAVADAVTMVTLLVAAGFPNTADDEALAWLDAQPWPVEMAPIVTTPEPSGLAPVVVTRRGW